MDGNHLVRSPPRYARPPRPQPSLVSGAGSEGQSGRLGGSAVALLILLSLLVGIGPVAGAWSPHRDPMTRLGTAQVGGAARGLRTGVREDDSRATDPAAPQPVMPPEPRIVVELLAARPSPPLGGKVSTGLGGNGSAPYRARAPPAA